MNNPLENKIHLTVSEDLNQPEEQQIVFNGETQLIEQTQNVNILLEVLKNSNKDKTHSQFNEKIQDHNRPADEANVKKDHENVPQPLESEEQQSIEAQYMSYIDNQQSEEQNSKQLSQPAKKQRQKLKGIFKKQFFSILYQSVIYVRKGDRRTKIDDDLLGDRLEQHLKISTLPEPKSLIGNALLVNGYFLCAYAILLGRTNHSLIIFKYVVKNFTEKLHKIEDNLEQFQYYSQTPHQNQFKKQQQRNSLLSSNFMNRQSRYGMKKVDLQERKLKRNVPQESRQNQLKQMSKQDSAINGMKQNNMISTRVTVGQISMQKLVERQNSPDC